MAKLAKADVIVSFSIPAYTALLKLNLLKAAANPQLVVSNVGSDPVTLIGLLEAFAKQGGATVKGSDLIQGIVTDSYMVTQADQSNSWIQLFKKVHDQFAPKLPMDGNVQYGMAAAWTFAEAVAKAGKNLTREGAGQGGRVRAVAGLRHRAVRVLVELARRLHRCADRHHPGHDDQARRASR